MVEIDQVTWILASDWWADIGAQGSPAENNFVFTSFTLYIYQVFTSFTLYIYQTDDAEIDLQHICKIKYWARAPRIILSQFVANNSRCLDAGTTSQSTGTS